MRECSQLLVFVIQLCDIAGNKLTESKGHSAAYDFTVTLTHE
jgi:hypothetical protein